MEENMTRPRAADDFAVIRARLDELRCERATRVRVADDFPAIRARMEELRHERVRASARMGQPVPSLADHTAPGGFSDSGRRRLLRAIRQKIHR
jgi:hypothetical protein